MTNNYSTFDLVGDGARTFSAPMERPRGTGVLHFFGDLTTIEGQHNDTYNSDSAQLVFTNLEVVRALEPFLGDDLTIYLRLNANPSPNTVYGNFVDSVLAITGEKEIHFGRDLYNKRIELEWAEGLVAKNVNEDSDPNARPIIRTVKGMNWVVRSIDGRGAGSVGKDLFAALAEMAEGKTEDEFYEAFFADESLKESPAYADMSGYAANKTLVDSLILGARIERDAKGILHKVK